MMAKSSPPKGERTREARAGETSGKRTIGVGPLQEQIGYALRRAQLAVFADVIAALAELDLSPAKYSVLAVIHENPGARSSDVGRALEIRKTNFAPLLDALEQRELVVRRASQEDRRTFALYLTAKGRALLERATRAQARHEARFVARIGEDGRARLLELLDRLTRESEKTVGDDGSPKQTKRKVAQHKQGRR